MRWKGSSKKEISRDAPASGLVRNYPVVFSVGVGGIDGSAEARILSGKVVLGDPTGPAAESSNRDANIFLHQKRHQLC